MRSALASMLFVLLVMAAPAQAQIVLSCLVDTDAFDPWEEGFCWASGSFGGPYSTTASFQVFGQIPGRSYSYQWSHPSCGSTDKCWDLPITVVPPSAVAIIDMEVIVTDLTTNTPHVVQARAEYYRF